MQAQEENEQMGTWMGDFSPYILTSFLLNYVNLPLKNLNYKIKTKLNLRKMEVIVGM